MSEVAVVLVRGSKNMTDEHEALYDVVHIAEDAPDSWDYYIWCWGNSASMRWQKLPEGTVPTCINCLARGPRKPWKVGTVTEVLKDGYVIVELNTETRGIKP